MTILVLGANGFIGSAVARKLASFDYNRVIGFVRRNPRMSSIDGVQYAVGDITDDASLMQAMRGVDTVVCCVSYVGSDEHLCLEVNDRGIKTVARSASDAGVDRLIYVSTASVYGTGPFRDLPVDGAPLNPHSNASRTRAEGERHVRHIGGLVVRPHLVYGPGDRWFVPALTSTIDRLGAVIDESSALLSTIHVDRLAHGIASITRSDIFGHGANCHLNDPIPERAIDVLTREHAGTGWTAPSASIDRSTAMNRATQLGIDRKYIDMISIDHWFRSRSHD